MVCVFPVLSPTPGHLWQRQQCEKKVHQHKPQGAGMLETEDLPTPKMGGRGKWFDQKNVVSGLS